MNSKYNSPNRSALFDIAVILIQAQWRRYRSNAKQWKLPCLPTDKRPVAVSWMRSSLTITYLGQCFQRIHTVEKALLVQQVAFRTVWDELRQYRYLFKNRLDNAVIKLQVRRKFLFSHKLNRRYLETLAKKEAN